MWFESTDGKLMVMVDEIRGVELDNQNPEKITIFIKLAGNYEARIYFESNADAAFCEMERLRSAIMASAANVQAVEEGAGVFHA